MSSYSGHPFDAEVYWDAPKSAPGEPQEITAEESDWLFNPDNLTASERAEMACEAQAAWGFDHE